MKAADVGFGSCNLALLTGIGPPLPPVGLVSSSWSSSFWNHGTHSSYDHPGQPLYAHWS